MKTRCGICGTIHNWEQPYPEFKDMQCKACYRKNKQKMLDW